MPFVYLSQHQVDSFLLREEKSQAPAQASTAVSDIPIELWCYITSYLTYPTSLHLINHFFFNVVMDCPFSLNTPTGLKAFVASQKPSLSQIQGMAINFKQKEDALVTKIPHYIWRSAIKSISLLPARYWFALPGTRIEKIYLRDASIGAAGVRHLGQELQNTKVRTVYLNNCCIGDIGARDFGQALKGTKIHTVHLCSNEITVKGASDFCQALKETQVHTVDLNVNYIGDIGAGNFGQALKGTKVHTVHLSYNHIGDADARDFGQILKETQVHTIHLKGNYIGNAGAHDFSQALHGTKVQRVDLSWNLIRMKRQKELIKDHPLIQFIFQSRVSVD